jgi:hypothetical protein
MECRGIGRVIEKQSHGQLDLRSYVGVVSGERRESCCRAQGKKALQSRYEGEKKSKKDTPSPAKLWFCVLTSVPGR